MKRYTLDDVKSHNTRDDCWVVIYGLVIDLTGFIDTHPGGDQVILRVAGTNATHEFSLYHSRWTLLRHYRKGIIGFSPSSRTLWSVFRGVLCRFRELLSSFDNRLFGPRFGVFRWWVFEASYFFKVIFFLIFFLRWRSRSDKIQYRIICLFEYGHPIVRHYHIDRISCPLVIYKYMYILNP